MPTKACVQELDKCREESCSIVSAPVSAEEVCFILAEQGSLLLRQTQGRKDQLVAPDHQCRALATRCDKRVASEPGFLGH